MIAQCTNCEMATIIQFKEQDHPKEIKETYFECQHCNKHYTCYVTDPEVRKMQQTLRMGGRRNGRTYLQNKVNQRMAKLKTELVSND